MDLKELKSKNDQILGQAHDVHGNKKTFIGYKLYAHDSSYVGLNCERNSIFTLIAERITRVKHDSVNMMNIIGTDIYHNSFIDIFEKNIFYYYNFYYWLLVFRIREYQGGSKYSFLARWFKILYLDPLLFFKIIHESIFGQEKKNIDQKIIGYNHHVCHGIPAYFFSPFSHKESIVFTLDGYGDGEYATTWLFSDNKRLHISGSKTYKISNKYPFTFCSIGLLYSCFTYTLGFIPGSDEGKTEALAAYGKPDNLLYNLCKECYVVDSENLIWKTDLSIGRKLHNKKFLQKELQRMGKENFSATIQAFLQDTVVEYLNAVYKKYPIPYLCLSGGVCANVILNLHIWEKTPFKNLYIFPAMGDDGTAFGPAIAQALEQGNDLSWLHNELMPYWGPSYNRSEILQALEIAKKNGAPIQWEEKFDLWSEDAAEMIANGKIVAVFQGRMEFGPRALGNRSILADARDPSIRDKMNLSIKKRPYFQPFCPSILESEREKIFQASYSNKHMTMAFRFKEEFRSVLPSACHIDGTARPQFVEERDNSSYFRLLSKMKELTGTEL